MKSAVLFFALTAFTIPAAAHAQAKEAADQSDLGDNFLSVGLGGLYGPSYEGSDDLVISPIPAVQGRLAGIGITPRPNGVAVDFINDPKGATIGFNLGPVATYINNRHSQIEDPVVLAAGKLKGALDVGVSGGVTFYKLLNPYDSLSVTTDVRWNVNDAYGGMLVLPSITYLTPLSRGALVTLSVFAKHADDDYARYYYGVSSTQSAASGLPVYNAKGGWALAGTGLLGLYDLDRNILNGGFALIGLAGYTRLLNHAKDNPYTAIRGSADQWTAGAGVAYTF